MRSKVLIIEDDSRLGRILQLLLQGNGYEVQVAEDGLEGIAIWKTWKPQVVLSDIKMPRADGLQVLEFKIREKLNAPLILLTAFGAIDRAVEAIKKGAFDYLTKPFDNNKVLDIIAQALTEYDKLPPDQPVPPAADHIMIGSSRAIQEIKKAVSMVAAAPTSVMITGESGTGKELVARAIHDQSPRRRQRLVRVNCAAIPRDLLESELFGHCKGAFTGAVSDRTGAFVKADGGTLFLDEIGDLPLDLQPKLLHAVEEKSILPIGSDRREVVDVKIVSATNRDLRRMIETGQFRSDLYYRLNTFQIHVPLLCERQEDIVELAEYFLKNFARAYQRGDTVLDEEIKAALLIYPWPGNIRELRNIMERAVLANTGQRIGCRDLPPEMTEAGRGTSLGGKPGPFDLQAQEQQLIIDALAKSGGNQSRAAQLLRISRNTLRYRMKKHGISAAIDTGIDAD